jgi:hypothetical protein
MNAPGTGIRILVAMIILLFCAGCTSPPDSPATEVPVSPPPAAQISPVLTTAIQVPETTVAAVPATTPEVIPVVATPTWIPKTYGRDTLDNPQIVLLTFRKECFIFDIPDCAMREVFPEAAGDPAYGIRQPVPKLVMIPGDEMGAFLRAHAGEYANDPDVHLHVDPASIAGTACTGGASGSPKWNFVRINATLIPRNARPGEYEIGINIRSRGIVIEQLRLNRSFEIDRPVIIVGYVPLRLDETDLFDTIDLVFARRA